MTASPRRQPDKVPTLLAGGTGKLFVVNPLTRKTGNRSRVALLSWEGQGSGEYGPVNHMMPITPVELGEGFIIGKERAVTCVSGTYAWNGARAPTVLVFDMNGRQVDFKPSVTKTGKGWNVRLKLRDWAQITVIE